MDGLTGLGDDSRLEILVPAKIVLGAVNGMGAGNAHGVSSEISL
jgi:hypothetical protein